MQAAFLRVKLQGLDGWTARRQVVAARYLNELAGVSAVALPVVPSWAEPVWHLFVIRHAQRDALQQRLAAEGIGTLIHYPVPAHLAGAYQDLGGKPGDFPLSETAAQTVLSLPIGPHLSLAQVDTVIAAIKAVA